MSSSASSFPNNPEALRSLLAEKQASIEQLLTDKQAVDQRNERLSAQVLSLQEQLNLALARRYAASSEKLSPDQIRLFDEAIPGLTRR